MADRRQKETADAVTLLNRGHRTYYTKVGKLAPGGSVSLPADQAKAFLVYPDVVDAAKAAPQIGRTISALRAENAALKAELEALKAPVKEQEAAGAGK